MNKYLLGIVIVLVIVAAGAFFVFSTPETVEDAVENLEEDEREEEAGSDSNVVANVASCNGYLFEYPDGWNAWSEQLESTAQCFISTWEERTIPSHLVGVYNDNVAVSINFAQTPLSTLDEYIENLYKNDSSSAIPTPKLVEKSEHEFNLGTGLGVTTEGRFGNRSMSYHYKDGSTIINMYVTDTSDQTLQGEAAGIISSLDRQ